METQIGRSLQGGKYTIEQEIGRGGFGITFTAKHEYLGQTVVIKTLNEALRQHPEFTDFQRKFQDEARRLALCVHPNIVRVSDFFIENSLAYMVMDYIPGKTLEEIVFPNQPLPEAVAIHYMRQIGAALNVVHRNGMLHRDIKPQNIILRQGSQEVILIDFGIAREFTPEQVQTHTSMISVGYAPLEQYLLQEKRSPATDVYGLAATLYALLTAQIPVASILRERQPLSEPRQLRPEISAQTNQAVMQGMAIEAPHRPSTIDQWLALLPNGVAAQAPVNFNQPTQTVATLRVSPQAVRQVPNPDPITRPPLHPLPVPDTFPQQPVVALPPDRGRSSRTLVLVTAAAIATLLGATSALLLSRTSQIAVAPAPENSPALPSPSSTMEPSPSVVPEPEPQVEPEPAASLSPEPTVSPEPTEPTKPEKVEKPEKVKNEKPEPTPAPAQTNSTARVPGFATGTSEDEIKAALGEPSKTSVGYWPNTRSVLYNLPQQVTLGLIYDRDSGRVRQTEVSFAQSSNLLQIQVALNGMVGSRASEAAVEGLQRVYQRQSGSYDFTQGNLKGVIQRNDQDRIYIGVWEADLH